MKTVSKLIAAIVLIQVVSAQDNVFAEFGSCQYESCPDDTISCCTFTT